MYNERITATLLILQSVLIFVIISTNFYIERKQDEKIKLLKEIVTIQQNTISKQDTLLRDKDYIISEHTSLFGNHK